MPSCVRIMLRDGMTQGEKQTRRVCDAVSQSQHESREHAQAQRRACEAAYVNAQDSFSCAGSLGGEAGCIGFHRHHITRLSKSFSRFENFGKCCGIRLCIRFCVCLFFLK